MLAQHSRASRIGWIAAILFGMLVVPRRGPAPEPLDFRLMWSAALATRSLQLSNYYDVMDSDRANEFLVAYSSANRSGVGMSPRIVRHSQATFTPMLIACFGALQSGDIRADHDRFQTLSKVVFAAGILVLGLTLGVHGLVLLTALWLSTLPSWSYRMALYLGNVGPLLTGLFMLGTSILRIRRPPAFAAAGFVLGLVAAIKPTFALGIPLLVITLVTTRRFRDLGCLAGGGALAVFTAFLLPAVVLGPDVTWWQWLAQVPGMELGDRWIRGGTFMGKTIHAVGAGLVKPSVLSRWGVLLNAAAFVFWFRTARTDVSEAKAYARDALALCSGTLLYLLSGPVVHSHYFLQAVPAAIVAMRPMRPSAWFVAPEAILALLGLFLIGGHQILQPLAPDIIRGVNHSWVTFVGVLIIFGLGILIQARRPTLAGVAMRRG